VEAKVFLRKLLDKLFKGTKHAWKRRTKALDVQVSSRDPDGDVKMGGEAARLEPVEQATLEEVETALEGCFVRLNQFVKTFADPTPEMLVENFFRSTGIACKENCTAADSLIPFVRFSEDMNTVQEENTSAIVVQAKLRTTFMGDQALRPWIESVRSRSYLQSDLPVVAILFDFGPRNSGSESGSVHIFRIPRSDNGFAIVCRRPSPSDIFETLNNDGKLNAAFGRLLESTINPSETRNVSDHMKDGVLKMFRRQPFGFGPKAESSDQF
jgi:hypothetical protein